MKWTHGRTNQQRFDDLVEKRGPEDCWLWQGAFDLKGYGKFSWKNSEGKHKLMTATRASVRLATGEPVPDGLLACHKCDNPPCVNPDHLFIGTHKDNTQDMIRKGRRAVAPIMKNEDHPLAVITWESAKEIRRLYATGEYRQQDLAEMYGVIQTTISMVTRNKRWVEKEAA